MFRLVASEVAIHGHSALLLWACGDTVHRGWSVGQRRPVHLRKQREGTGLRPSVPLRVHPQ